MLQYAITMRYSYVLIGLSQESEYEEETSPSQFFDRKTRIVLSGR
jgi:hypothetical protein